MPGDFGGRIVYLLQQYGGSFLKGAGVTMVPYRLCGRHYPDDSRGEEGFGGKERDSVDCQIYFKCLCRGIPGNAYDGTGNVYLFWLCGSI